MLTQHPEDAAPADGVTFLNCGPAEAVRIGLAAAGGKNLEVFSPTIGRQLLERGLIDEIDLHIAPVLLGEGIRLYDNPGSESIRLHRASSTVCGPGSKSAAGGHRLTGGSYVTRRSIAVTGPSREHYWIVSLP